MESNTVCRLHNASVNAEKCLHIITCNTEASVAKINQTSKSLKCNDFCPDERVKKSFDIEGNFHNTPRLTGGRNLQNRRVLCSPNGKYEDSKKAHVSPLEGSRKHYSEISPVGQLYKRNTKFHPQSIRNVSLKRSYSFSSDSSPEANYGSTLHAKFINESKSDTALIRPDRHMSSVRTVEYASSKVERGHQENSFKRRSYPMSTPKTRFSDSSHSLSHRRSYSCRKSAADQTPFSPARPLSQGRIKRMRTPILPGYESHSELMMLNPDVGVIDSHCHLDFLFTRANFNESYASYRIAHRSSYPTCYEACIAIFCEPQNFCMKPEWDCILQEKGVFGAFGCHPHMAKNYDDHAEKALEIALNDPKVIALGEIGLDYSNRNSCQKHLQHNVFRRQISIALERKMPLVIHCREAHDDCMEIMQELVPKDHRIHLHCFTDKWAKAKEWLDAFPNLFIGITNLVTFPSAEDVHETATKIPLERLLLETDSPYFVPRNLPQQMRWSHPGLVIHAAAQIASLKRTVTVTELLKSVRENTRKMYGI